MKDIVIDTVGGRVGPGIISTTGKKGAGKIKESVAMEKLLIVDDSEDIRKQLKWGFTNEYTMLLAGDAQEALALFSKHLPKVVVLDLGLPPHPDGTEEGFRCLEEMLKAHYFTKVIIATGNGDIGNALRAVQGGAYDFLQKPIDLGELKVIIRRAFNLHALEEENRRLRSVLDRKDGALSGIFGQCPSMLDVFATVRKVATSNVAVLIQGESGTGKELVARAIHAMSPRRERDFVPINCGAIPENLLESELFGHEKGSFTGAHAQVQGKVEFAHSGTLFLDEIGELPASLQVKLLRFLQDKTIQRVGGREDIIVDARIIAASNRIIGEEIAAGRFREDLYYRIGVVTIQLPPLRERNEDIAFLGTLFLRRFGDEFKKRIKGFSSTSLELMESYAWPGNVRELENKVQRAVILSETALIEPHDLGLSDKAAASCGSEPVLERRTLKEARDRLEREMIMQAMDRHKGNIAQASEELGISRPTFYDIMKKQGLFHATNGQES
jgi:two-component system NtrC family response regulator